MGINIDREVRIDDIGVENGQDGELIYSNDFIIKSEQVIGGMKSWFVTWFIMLVYVSFAIYIDSIMHLNGFNMWVTNGAMCW